MPKKLNLKRWREATGMNRAQLAARIGISAMTVMRCEVENRWPVNDILARAYKKALGIV